MKQPESPPRPTVGRPADQPTDESLVRRMMESDVGALESLYDRYASRVFALCLRMLRDREQSEEVLQDCFWQLWKRPDSYDPKRGSVATFLFQIARSRCLDRLRFEQRRGARANIGEAVLELREFASKGPTPFQSALSAEERSHIRNGLDQLPPEYREALVLAYFDGLTQSEIAAATRSPLGTVKTRIRRGLLRLRTLLEREGNA